MSIHTFVEGKEKVDIECLSYAYNLIQSPVAICNAHGKIVFTNRVWDRVFALSDDLAIIDTRSIYQVAAAFRSSQLTTPEYLFGYTNEEKDILVNEVWHTRDGDQKNWWKMMCQSIVIHNQLHYLFFAHEYSVQMIDVERLYLSEKRMRSMIENRRSVVYFYNQHSQLEYVNRAFEILTGYTRDELYALQVIDYIHPEDKAWVQKYRDKAFKSGQKVQDIEYRIVTKEGLIKWCVGSWTPVFNSEGVLEGVEGRERDITYRVHNDNMLRENEMRFRMMADSAPVMIWVSAVSGGRSFFNKSWLEFTGKSITAQVGYGWQDGVHPDDLEEYQRIYRQAFQDLQNFKAEYRLLRYDGSYRWVIDEGVPRFSETGEFSGYTGSVVDITERKSLEEKLLYDAFYDPLTGLANRKLFVERLQECLLAFQKDNSRLYSVLYLDIDRFKIINDSLGHSMGDELLVQVAKRLQSCARPTDLIARLGGDEFTILVEEISDICEVVSIAERIREAFQEPFHLGHNVVTITSSIGIAPAKNDYFQPDTVLRDADTAMYRAKNAGKNQYQIFDQTMHTRVLKILRVDADLRKAVKNNELCLYYQPIFSIEQKKLIGCEALIRWNHPEKGLLNPQDFLEVAEETGLILELDKFALYESCRQNKAWQQQGFPAIPVAVNVSLKQFKNKEFLNMVSNSLEETGLDSAFLEIELSENVLIDQAEETIKIFEELKRKNIALWVDDFGTGFSSLTYLKFLPITGLKIDKSFIRDINRDGQTHAIIESVIGLAQNLQLKVVAEGVETVEQLDFLGQESCFAAQGFMLGKPVDSQSFFNVFYTNKQNSQSSFSIL